MDHLENEVNPGFKEHKAPREKMDQLVCKDLQETLVHREFPDHM